MNSDHPKILMVEDELALGQIVADSLKTRGFDVFYVAEGTKVLSAFVNFKPDIILLDIMLPGLDGFSIIDEIRKTDQQTPVIFLTAKSQTEDVIKGFEKGANDYVRKPYNIEELIVRINSLLKRNRTKNASSYEWNIGSYQFNFVKQELVHLKEKFNLTSREAELLKILYENKNQLTDKKVVLLELWGDDSVFNGRSMDVFITKLRKYFRHDTSISILNVRGLGYKLVV